MTIQYESRVTKAFSDAARALTSTDIDAKINNLGERVQLNRFPGSATITCFDGSQQCPFKWGALHYIQDVCQLRGADHADS